MSTPDTSHGDGQAKSPVVSTLGEVLRAAIDESKLSQQTVLAFGKPTTMDMDVVCPQIDRDEFKAFVEQQAGNDIGKTVRLIDYIFAKELYKLVWTAPLKRTLLERATVQETVAFTISVRDNFFAQPNNPKAAWEMLLTELQRHSIAHGYKKKMEDTIQSLGCMVSMEVWDQVWRWFLANYNVNCPNTSIAMASNLLKFIDAKDSKEAGDQAILVSLADWINEWMEHVLKK